MSKSAPSHSWRVMIAVIVAAVVSAAWFLALTLPKAARGAVIGTGQDEWYNVIRALRALYEFLNPAYFIHPALYYEILAFLYGLLYVAWKVEGTLGGGTEFLDRFLADETLFLNLARHTSVAGGALAVLAAGWLGHLLSGPPAALLVGFLVASLPLLQVMSIAIRVDAVALAALLFACCLIMRWHRSPSDRSLLAAAIGIGVAAAANYPGALLLGLLAWLRWGSPGRALPEIIRVCAVAFVVFLVLNPYAILDFQRFWAWFTFQSKMSVLVHPHAEEPSVTRYLMVLRDQGLPVIVACLAGVSAMIRPRSGTGAIAAYAVAQLVAFSLMQTQYDRFVLPGITLLCIAGVAWTCRLAVDNLPRLASAGVIATACLLVLWLARTRSIAEEPWDPGPDYRAEMLAWIEANVPSSATLVIESDTLSLVQTVFDPGDDTGRFQNALRRAFDKLHPQLVKRIVKAQFIAAVYNYDPKVLEAPDVYFLASSQNREFIGLNRAVLDQPAAFYEALDARATVVHETGFHEKLLLYSTSSPPGASSGRGGG